MALFKVSRGTYAKIIAAEKDADQLYLATDKQALYLGNNLLSSQVTNATFANNILIITKLDGSKLTLDFSDVPSGEAVSSLLAAIRTDVNTNKSDITTIKGQIADLQAGTLQAADKSISISGNKVKVNVSTTANNALTLDANGLFVAKPTAYTGSNAIKVSGQTISLTLDGTSLSQSATGLKSTLKLQKKTAGVDASLSSAYQLVDGNGTVYGDDIEIVKDQFLKSVTLDTSDNLVFVFSTTSGDVTEKVNIAKYIDTYTAGNGITIAGKQVSAKAAAGDKYVEVTANGIASKGIDDAISTAVSNSSTYIMGQVNAVENSLNSHIAGVKTYAADGKTIDSSTSSNTITFSVKNGVYDSAGSANNVKTQLIGSTSDAATALTIYGAKKHAETVAATAKSEAIASAATTAQQKADAAKNAAISAAATDATNKANTACDTAKTYAESLLTWIEL